LSDGDSTTADFRVPEPSSKTPSITRTANTTLNVGIVELQMGNSETALGWFQRALDEFRKLEDRAEEANALERLCHVAQPGLGGLTGYSP